MNQTCLTHSQFLLNVFFELNVYIYAFIACYAGLAGEGNKPTAGQIELRLVQSLDDIRNPKITFKAQVVSN